MTRGALAAAGFVRHEAEGRVWFESADVIPSEVEGPGGRVAPRSSLIAPHTRPGPSTDARDDSSTLVLLHGANDHAGTWFLVAPALAKKYRVLIPDLAGHGESAPASGPIPISLILSQLAALLQDEREITLAGNSLGGWMALLYTLKHPHQIARLVLEASGGLSRPIESPLVAHTREEAFTILRAVHGPRFTPQEWVVDALLQRASDSPMLRLTEAIEHAVEPRLGEIDVPATLIWGSDDGVLPLSYAEALHERIAGSRLHVIEGAGHIPHMQQPERFLACLTATS